MRNGIRKESESPTYLCYPVQEAVSSLENDGKSEFKLADVLDQLDDADPKLVSKILSKMECTPLDVDFYPHSGRRKILGVNDKLCKNCHFDRSGTSGCARRG